MFHHVLLDVNHTVDKMVVGASLKATRASPKSKKFSLQSTFANTFFGFRSWWNTLAKLKPKHQDNNILARHAKYKGKILCKETRFQDQKNYPKISKIIIWHILLKQYTMHYITIDIDIDHNSLLLKSLQLRHSAQRNCKTKYIPKTNILPIWMYLKAFRS